MWPLISQARCCIVLVSYCRAGLGTIAQLELVLVTVGFADAAQELRYLMSGDMKSGFEVRKDRSCVYLVWQSEEEVYTQIVAWSYLIDS